MDNAFAAVEDPAALQQICDRLCANDINALLRRWLAILPHPFTAADREAGYRYDLSILQAEFSLTQMLDAPVSGRMFFDRRLIHGRRRHTPSRWRTRVITDGVTPSLHVDYKRTTIKQYHKEGRALRTETTINDTRDFEIGKRLVNLPALREIGFQANRRLLGVQRLDHDPIIGAAAVTDPITTDTGARISGLRLGQRRSHALLAALLIFRLHPNGFSNADLRALTAQLRGLPEHDVSASQMTYDLRRLRSHGLIQRLAHTHRYRVTDHGLHTAMFLTRVHDRLLPTGLAHLTEPGPNRTPLRTAAHAYQKAVDDLVRKPAWQNDPHQT